MNLVGQRNTIKALDYRLKLKRIKPNFTLDPLQLKIEEEPYALPTIGTTKSLKTDKLIPTQESSLENLYAST